MRKWLPWGALLVVLAVALLAGADDGGDGGEAGAASRSARLTRELRCPTCRGLSVADSDAKAAVAIRDEVRARVDAGQSDDQIRRYLVSRYGEDILLKPRGSGVTGLVWALPVVAVVGAAGGLALAFRRWSAGPVTERQEFLERSIADLDAERAAGDLSAADHTELRSRYEAALERLGRDSGTHSGAVSRPGRGVRLMAVVLVLAMVATGAGVAVAQFAGERLPGEPSSGDVELGMEDRLAQAQALVQEGKALEAIKLYDAILEDEPRQPAALAQRGWVLRSVGLVDEGLTYIDRAIAADPTFAEAHFFRGMILWRDKQDAAGGVAELRRFLTLTPSGDDAATVEGLLRQAEAEAGGATTVPQQ